MLNDIDMYDNTYMNEYSAGLNGAYQWPISFLDNPLGRTIWVMGYLDGLGDAGHKIYAEVWSEFYYGQKEIPTPKMIEEIVTDRKGFNG